MEWRNQVAVVTGGVHGIGQATARLLAQRGAAVRVNYAVHAELLRPVRPSFSRELPEAMRQRDYH
jgi:NAD(P)-dependent dehydrogenase (short-subunit alcohol dehydrogenase family)